MKYLIHPYSSRLFNAPEGRRAWYQIIGWWECRRIPYNIIVAVAGAISLGLYFFFVLSSGKLGPGEDAVEPIALLAAPLAVNLAYTAGWMTELVLCRIRPKRTKAFGPMLLAAGLLLSLFVVFLPAGVWFAMWVGSLF